MSSNPNNSQSQTTHLGRKIDTTQAEAENKAAATAFTQGVLDTPVPAGTKVTYGAGRKISDNNYGSLDFHCSISLESNGSQTPRELVQQGIAFTEAVIGSKVKQAKAAKLGY